MFQYVTKIIILLLLLTINIGFIKQINTTVTMLRNFYNNITIFNNIQKDFGDFRLHFKQAKLIKVIANIVINTYINIYLLLCTCL